MAWTAGTIPGSIPMVIVPLADLPFVKLGPLSTAVVVGVVASSALVLGSAVGAYVQPSDRVDAVLLAFASGALITALAYDLFQEAYETAGAVPAATGLLAGAATFIAADTLLDRYEGSGSGLGILAGVTFDGVPENLALGVSLVGSGSVGILALLAAIFASNFPEAMSGTKDLVNQDRSKAFALGVWTATALLLTIAVVAGFTVFGGLNEVIVAVVRAFAGGAVLASVAATTLPQAFEEGSPPVALATVVGFLLTFLLGG